MERIRKALDMARMERAQPAAPKRIEGAREIPANVSNVGVPAIVYTRTKTFTPSPDALERNRILDPAANQPAVVAYRMLRTQVLQRMNSNGWRSIAVFSPGSNDGKTTTAINLAVSLANDRRHTVLLVEFDLKHPTLAARFGFEPQLGGDDVFAGRASVQECLYHPEGFDRLVVMPTKGRIANSSEMLAGPRSHEMVGEFRIRYPDRIVVYDLPPVLTADDALAFAPLVECGLMVASEGRTRRDDLVRTIELLQNTPLVGTVLNRATEMPAGY